MLTLPLDATLLTLLALLALWPAAALAVVWRLTNSTGKIEWENKTTEAGQRIAKLRRELVEAREAAARMRDQLERKDGT